MRARQSPMRIAATSKGLVEAVIVYNTLIGVGAMASVVGWLFHKRCVNASEAAQSKADEKTRKRFTRHPAADGPGLAVEERSKKREFGRR